MIDSEGSVIEDEISTGESPAPGTYCGNGRVSIYLKISMGSFIAKFSIIITS